MSKIFKVKTEAVINRHAVGAEIELDEKTAKTLEAMKYVKIISEVKPKAAPKKAIESKKATSKKAASKAKTDDKK